MNNSDWNYKMAEADYEWTPPKIEILPELRDLIPPLKDDELAVLHDTLETSWHSFDPITVWHNHPDGIPVIVDGHHRYEWFKKNGRPFDVTSKAFSSIEMAKDWMIRNQLGRRNLDPKSFTLLIGDLYIHKKKPAHGNNNEGVNQHSELGDQNEHQPKADKTAEEIAKEHRVGQATVRRSAEVAKALDTPDKRKDWIEGKDKRSRKEIIESSKPKPKRETHQLPPAAPMDEEKYQKVDQQITEILESAAEQNENPRLADFKEQFNNLYKSKFLKLTTSDKATAINHIKEKLKI